MTRWARGSTSQSKNPHEGTSWQDLQLNQQKVQKTEKSKKKEIHETTTIAPPSTWMNGDKTDGSSGLAAELESLGAVSGMIQRQVSSKCKKNKQKDQFSGNKIQKCKKDKIKLDIGNKTKSFLKTELTQNLSKVTQSLKIKPEEQKELEDVLNKDQRREKRRQKRIVEKEGSKTCFNCRRRGHTVEDCPENRSHTSGICFKCGSTEHHVNQCRVKSLEGKFPYAQCFICGEQGHLSKQCPDNPRGMYPNGGCCRTCSSVEHYNKDCPLLQKQKGIEDYRLPTINSALSTDEEISLRDKPSQKHQVKSAKVVKF